MASYSQRISMRRFPLELGKEPFERASEAGNAAVGDRLESASGAMRANQVMVSCLRHHRAHRGHASDRQ